MTTDDGFCCVFNAFDPSSILKPESAELPPDLDFLNQTEYIQVECDEDDDDCEDGYTGANVNNWYNGTAKWNHTKTRDKRYKREVRQF